MVPHKLKRQKSINSIGMDTSFQNKKEYKCEKAAEPNRLKSSQRVTKWLRKSDNEALE